MVNKHKNLESRHFYNCPLRQNYRSGSYLTSQGNYSLPPGIIWFKIYPHSKKGGIYEEQLPIINQVLANYPEMNKMLKQIIQMLFKCQAALGIVLC